MTVFERVFWGVAIAGFGLAAACAQGTSIDATVLQKANGGDAAAQVQAGELYAKAAATEQDRDVIPQDWKLVETWYRKAAEQGYIPGELHLAALYRDGGGKTIARDMVQAAAWYRKAAEQGDTGAQGTVGMLYMLGQGVARSDGDAYFWLDVAANTPGPNQGQYIANRQTVGMRLTTTEVDDIHYRAMKWKAAHPPKAPVN
jgi:hypothetical protein